MREIKYRIYDKLNKKMFYWSKEYREIELEVALSVPERFVVMQYIGRKDINNKDIYEDDIVGSYEDDDKKKEIYIEGVISFFDNLNWDGGGSLHPGFYVSEWCEHGYEGGLSYHDGFDEAEIVGNKHENPELIKEKNHG